MLVPTVINIRAPRYSSDRWLKPLQQITSYPAQLVRRCAVHWEAGLVEVIQEAEVVEAQLAAEVESMYDDYDSCHCQNHCRNLQLENPVLQKIQEELWHVSCLFSAS